MKKKILKFWIENWWIVIFLKLVNRELFMTKLSEIDFHENELIDVEGMKLFKPIWLSTFRAKAFLAFYDNKWWQTVNRETRVILANSVMQALEC